MTGTSLGGRSIIPDECCDLYFSLTGVGLWKSPVRFGVLDEPWAGAADRGGTRPFGRARCAPTPFSRPENRTPADRSKNKWVLRIARWTEWVRDRIRCRWDT